jgi:co-chaperonin GroES (HSP10)
MAGVGAGSSCTITVTFSPTAAWSRGGSIVIADSAYENPQQVVLLVGMGNSGAAASVSPSSLSFGDQTLGTSSSAKTITLSNTGSAGLNINSILANGDYSQTNNCPASLNAGAKCTINVTFAPTDTGSRTGDVTVNDTDAAFLHTVSLSGTGEVASSAVSVSPGQGSITPTQTEQFSATINGVTSTNVSWSVDGIAGGNDTVGTISTSGLYTPPATSATHIIQATNNANSAQTAVAFLAVTSYSGTFTHKNDALRSGQNLDEIALTTGNVNKTQFGKLFSRSVDGNVYAQPLYVSDVTTSVGTYNVVYVVTENDTVFAFDADGTDSSPLWQTSFLTGGAQVLDTTDVNCANITPSIGITSTPVIDPLTNTMFVLGRTKTGTSGNYTYYQTLYALDITTGAILQSVQVQASVSSKSGTVAFNPLTQNQRAALLLENGVVYIAWASHCDKEPYHGWVIGYNETTLQQSGVFLATPNGEEGGIWQGGTGVAADASGNLFFTTGNGTFDGNTGGTDYGDSVLKLTTTGGMLAVGDSFTPFNQESLTIVDWDVGAGGTMLLPDQAGTYPHVMLSGGKGSTVYELNRDSLGGFNTSANQNLLTVPAVLGADKIGAGNRSAGPAYWQEQVYYAGSDAFPMQFSVQGSLISTVPIVLATKHFGYPGGSPVVSANGNGNGIVWIIETDEYSTGGAAILRAFDASNVSRELYDTTEDSSRDTPGPAVKFTVPTVANGKVYVGTQTELDVYGLLP